MKSETQRKYNFMKFELGKLEKICNESPRSVSNIDAESGFRSFCSECYHLKDWLISEYPDMKKSIEGFISTNDWLSICADFTNQVKHKKLNKKPRHKEIVTHGNNHTFISLTNVGFIAKSKYEVKVGDKSFDSYEIASQAFDAWNQFLEDNNLN